jgi:hypothetical protein
MALWINIFPALRPPRRHPFGARKGSKVPGYELYLALFYYTAGLEGTILPEKLSRRNPRGLDFHAWNRASHPWPLPSGEGPILPGASLRDARDHRVANARRKTGDCKSSGSDALWFLWGWQAPPQRRSPPERGNCRAPIVSLFPIDPRGRARLKHSGPLLKSPLHLTACAGVPIIPRSWHAFRPLPVCGSPAVICSRL